MALPFWQRICQKDCNSMSFLLSAWVKEPSQTTGLSKLMVHNSLKKWIICMWQSQGRKDCAIWHILLKNVCLGETLKTNLLPGISRTLSRRNHKCCGNVLATKNQIASTTWIMRAIQIIWVKSHKQICLRLNYRERVPQPYAAAVHSKRQEYIWLCRRRCLLLRRLYQRSAAKDFGIQNPWRAVRLQSRPHLRRLTPTWHRSALLPSTRGFAPPSGNQRGSTLICYVFENYCNLILQFTSTFCMLRVRTWISYPFFALQRSGNEWS